MYWRAYALSKLGKRDESLAGLAALKQSYPSGRWLNDARALELEVQQASGQPVSPDRQSDEDLKLMAINALAGSDPERTVPLLENILKGSNSPKMKERALFVLAQSRTPRGQEVLVNAARGGANPDLQLKAVEYLGVYGGKDNSKALADIYAGTSDVAVKRAVLRGYMISRDKERVLALAKGESNPELRREAVQMLGAMRGQAELWQLYQSETAPENRVHIIQALGISGGGDRVIELARTEKDPKVRRAAIQSIAISRSPQASEALLSIYGSESDKETKKQVVSGLFILRNAKSLVDLARKETDPEMKRDIVEKLSVMKSKEATDYMVELLK
jgi:HEAT repeat protein